MPLGEWVIVNMENEAMALEALNPMVERLDYYLNGEKRTVYMTTKDKIVRAVDGKFPEWLGTSLPTESFPKRYVMAAPKRIKD